MDQFLGEIRMFAGNFAPRGWAFCEGQLLAISSNTALFSLLGTVYGGDGRTTFALPDLRGRAPIGVGSGPGLSPVAQGQKSGVESVHLTVNELPVHAPQVTVQVAVPAVAASTNVAAAPSDTTVLGPVTGGGRPGTLYSTDAADTTLKPFNANVTVTPMGAGAAVPVRNPYLGMNYIICTQGIFPSRN
ncbi:phage tail protein [Cellvibrio sp. NN19]|uniref:phage tail protein n=1 Tax=Cellvibrio chitinivorans TaxID=3102792 RepID=UPI002B402FF8|nr:tail fiber protein [Cellvibrio sp. NN19]